MKILPMLEAVYPGNIGAEEMLRFFMTATQDQKAKMRNLLRQNKTQEAYDFLQDVLKIKLK